MPYTARRYATTREVPAEAWNEIHRAHGDAFTDLRFLEIVEQTLGSSFRFAPVIVFDDSQRPAGIFCVSTCRLDATTLADETTRKLVGGIRRVWPGFLRFTLVMCGLPVTVPQVKPCVRPEADMNEIMRLMDETACDFARRHRAAAVLLGDFPADACSVFDRLLSCGYSRFASAPMHYLMIRHRSIPEYIAAMRAGYRANLNIDIRKFDERRVCVETVTDDDKLAAPVTEEFYELYLQLLSRVDFHLVTLPREFFNRLVQLYHREIHLLRVRVDGRPAGITMGLMSQDTYWGILIAVDAELNRRYGLYPNLFLNRIDHAMSLGLKQINLGTTADEFKLRLGSSPRPMRIYVKALGVLRLPFAWTSRFLLKETTDLKPQRVFRSEESASTTGPARRRNEKRPIIPPKPTSQNREVTATAKVSAAELGDVQETALLTLWSRAVEMQQQRPILRDPKAAIIVAAIDYDFEKFRAYPRGQIGCCCRAEILDDYVTQFLERRPDGVVVDIGAGLDTRFERVDNGRVHWFDLDLPDAVAMRRRFFQETDRRRFLIGSVFDPSWIESVLAINAEDYLFVAEGVLLYFDEARVRGLLSLLAERFPGARFALDACSPLMQRTARWFEAVGTTRARFRWGTSDLRSLERWDARYRVLDVAQVTRQHRDRWPTWVRLLNAAAPFTRNFYTAGLVQLGTRP